MNPAGFTLLEATGTSQFATKTFTRDWLADGEKAEIRAKPYDNISTWSGREVPVSGIEDLHVKLSKIIERPRCCIVRGSIIEGTSTEKMLRRKNPRFDEKTGELTAPATIEACPRQLAMFDMDGYLPAGAGLDFIASHPEEALELVFSLMPEALRNALRDVSFVYEWGSSAGVFPKLSVHLFFWLSRPVPDDVLHLWAMELAKANPEAHTPDPAVFDPIQVHYVAAPRFQGDIEDPLPGRRLGFKKGKTDELDVDALMLPNESAPDTEEEERVKRQVASRGLRGTSNGFFGYLRAIGRPHFHEPIKSAIGSYIKHHGAEGTDVGALVELLKERILDAEDGGRDKGEIERYASEGFLRPFIRFALAAHQAPQATGAGHFRNEHCRLSYAKEDRDGGVQIIPLANFIASIARETVVDDGITETRYFEIDGTVDTGQKLPTIRVPAAQFAGMGWPTASWGARAYVFSGASTKDRAREAIQRLSGSPPEARVYASTGWRRFGEEWRYLHAGGAIGKNGNDPSVAVELEDVLSLYHFPAPPVDPAAATRRTFDALLDSFFGPDRITIPLFAAAHRSVLNEFCAVDEGVFLEGPTGTGKSSVQALFQAMFGPGFTATKFPGSWESTSCLLYTSPSPRDGLLSRMPSSA